LARGISLLRPDLRENLNHVDAILTDVYRSKSYPAISPQRDILKAKGKIVLITGAGSGIGAATAKAFAEAGAKAIVLWEEIGAATEHYKGD
jgi:FlaA1/EpsC-like NDP-sugar epimerase